MAIQTTANLTPFHAQFKETYEREAMFNRLYDQFAVPFPGDMAKMMSGSSVTYPFLSDMDPGVPAISHTVDGPKKRGKTQAESVDLLAQAAALQGTFVYRAAARASLDAGTTAHRASDALFARMEVYLMNARVPGFIT